MNAKQSSTPTYTVKVQRHLPMRTRDGVTLYADVYRPEAPGKFPVLVCRTPYDKSQDLALTEKDYFPPRGYVLVVQDTRGRFSSEGDFYPFIHEGNDGYDTIEWAAALPCSNGVVGTVGQSYLGLVQYHAAPMRPPHLKAMCPVSGPVTYFQNCVYRRGVFELGWMLTYFTFMARNTLARKGIYDREGPILDRYLSHPDIPISPLKADEFRHLPLSDWAERLGKGAPYFADYLRHWKDDSYWAETDLRDRCAKAAVPVLHVGSWYDAFQYDTLAMYTAMHHHSATPEARRGQKLIMGPWAHLMPYAIPTSRGTGDIDFGPEAKVELHAIQLRWFDQLLKGLPTGMLEEPPVRIFVMGDNRWRDESEWPLKRTTYTKVFLHSRGGANSLSGDGSLSLVAASGDEAADHYLYDPADPVPTRGGATLGLPPGVYDQSEIEQRKDVLVYTGEPLAEPLEITGPVSMKLFAASSAPDTDFMAKLIDVRPDRYAHNLAEGVVRARFRESLNKPSPITPGKTYEYSIDMWATSHVFKRGHRVRLEITSSNFPRYDRNPNTGNDFAVDTELRTAQQTIFHALGSASHLVLPVIPR
jgi:uncharacterized protein